MGNNGSDQIKRAALEIVHGWMVDADVAGPQTPAELGEAVELPEGCDFDTTDYGDTGNLFEALYRCSRWPWYRSRIPWAVQRLAEARQEYADMQRQRGPPRIAPSGAVDDALHALLEELLEHIE